MNTLVRDKDIQIIKLNGDAFFKEKEYFINSFKEISSSNNLEEILDWERFFSYHKINTVIYAIKNGKIVSYLYATKLNDYLPYKNVDSSNWHIGYIKTHIHYQNQGIGTEVLLASVFDMIRQGAERITYTPNEQSRDLFEKLAEEQDSINIDDENFGRKALIKNKITNK